MNDLEFDEAIEELEGFFNDKLTGIVDTEDFRISDRKGWAQHEDFIMFRFSFDDTPNMG